MNITHIGHASILIEAGGLHLLCDPWWRGPCFGSQWWIYPPPFVTSVNHRPPDYIYISHGHEDHFHPPTLRTFPRSVPLLVARGASFISEARSLGFSVIEIAPDEARELGGGVVCRITPTYAGDTLMTLTDGKETVVNLNDSLHALPAYARLSFMRGLRKRHPQIDYLFCGHGVASHFPNCYVIPGKDREATAKRRQLFFNRVWSDIVYTLRPRFAFPFAADVVLLENDLQWANEPVHNAPRPTEVFRTRHCGAPTKVFDLAPGFRISGGEVIHMRLREPLRLVDVLTRYPNEVARANRYGSARKEALKDVRDLLTASISRRIHFFKRFRGDYRLLIRFRGGPSGLAITKIESAMSVEAVADISKCTGSWDLIFTTKLAYLQRSLTTRYGSDLLFVGSGGIFEFASQNVAARGLHDEFMAMVSPLAPRDSRLMQRFKSMVRRLLNRDELDLYNLRRWTEFHLSA